jgi:hypothetical protein
VVQGQAVIDAGDVDLVGRYRWCLRDGYAVASDHIDGRTIHVRLHRLILGLTDGDAFEADHIDRNRLNCRRSNLRKLPKSGRPNTQNKSSYRGSTSAYRGVSLRKNGKWNAQIQVQGKKINLGYFFSEIEAAEVARAARARLMPFAID